MKNKLLAFLSLLLILSQLLPGCTQPLILEKAQVIMPDGAIFNPVVARSEGERAAGLSGKESLENNTGMLFVFESAGSHGFWMTRMKFPIDILYLDSSFTVVDAKLNVQPCPEVGECPVFKPSQPALYVLEIGAGEAGRHSASVGSTLRVLFRGTV